MEPREIPSSVAERLGELWERFWAMRELAADAIADEAVAIIGDDDELLRFVLRAFEETDADDSMTLQAWSLILPLTANVVLFENPRLNDSDIRTFLLDGRESLEEMARRTGIADWCASLGFPMRNSAGERISRSGAPATDVPMRVDEAVRMVAEFVPAPPDASKDDVYNAASDARKTLLDELAKALALYDQLLTRIAAEEDLDADDLSTLEIASLTLLIAARFSGTVVLRTLAWDGDAEEAEKWGQRVLFALLLGIGLSACANTSSHDERARLALPDGADLQDIAELLPRG